MNQRDRVPTCMAASTSGELCQFVENHQDDDGIARHSWAPCTHPAVYWQPGGGLNEDAWRCEDCPEVLGFRPDLDRSHTFAKVRGILSDFHESKLIYISNGTMGDVVADNVAQVCECDNRYDQWSILGYILDDLNLNSHAPYWKRQAFEWLEARSVHA